MDPETLWNLAPEELDALDARFPGQQHPELMTAEQRATYEEEFPEEDLADFLDWVERHGSAEGYTRPPEAHDQSLSATPHTACVLRWVCRHQGGTSPGCERHCLFTRDVREERPRCFGFNSGEGLLEPGDFLFGPLNLACMQCRSFLACAEATEACGGCGG